MLARASKASNPAAEGYGSVTSTEKGSGALLDVKDPSKSRRKDEDLPRLEPDLLPSQRALNVGQLLDKPVDIVRGSERLPGFGLQPGVELVGAGLSLELN